ncbi:MAG: DUF433 domain-containing protein [Planctomycetia bacterium]|nr:DUF433 domain-containing protein [Planctomycetia bacterium]
MQTTYPHIELRADGIALITGTTTKVVEVVQDHLAHHWDAYELRRQYPHLGLSQIHAALGYYYDNQDAIDRDIAMRLQRVREIESRRADSFIADKLRQAGHLS